MNRIAGIILAALGLVIAVLSILKVIPGLTQPGVVMILTGGVIIGLSFISKPEGEDVETMSTGATLGNIFFAPSEVFRALRRRPRFLVAMILMSLMGTIYTNLFLQRLGPERVANFTLDKMLEMPIMNDQAKEQVEKGRPQAIADAKDPVKRGGQAVASLGQSLIFYAIGAGILLLVMLALGGKINYWQAFSTLVYAAFPVAVLRFVLNTLVLYLKDPSDIHPILGQQTLIQDSPNFLVLSSEHPVIFTLLGAFSLLGFYWVFLLGTGLKNAGERVSGTAAWSAAIGIYVLLSLLALSMAAVFPSFIS
jgi:hypothetical protein